MAEQTKTIEQIKERYRRRKNEEVLRIIDDLAAEYEETLDLFGDTVGLQGFLDFVEMKVENGEDLG